MLKHVALIGFASGILALSGCGGSSSETPSIVSGQNAEFGAALADGGELSLDFDSMSNGNWSGEYEFYRVEAPTADDEGTFVGTNHNGNIDATFTSLNGATFRVTGKAEGSGFKVSRVDDPGVVYNIIPPSRVVAGPNRGTVTFNYQFRGMKGPRGEGGTVSMSESYQTEGAVRLYEGTMDGNRVRVAEVPSGNYFSITWWINDYERNMTVFDGGFNSLRSGTLRPKANFVVPEVVTHAWVGQVYSGGIVSH